MDCNIFSHHNSRVAPVRGVAVWGWNGEPLAVPVFSSGGSSGEGAFLCFSAV